VSRTATGSHGTADALALIRAGAGDESVESRSVPLEITLPATERVLDVPPLIGIQVHLRIQQPTANSADAS
jgi:hypothetical protein